MGSKWSLHRTKKAAVVEAKHQQARGYKTIIKKHKPKATYKGGKPWGRYTVYRYY